MGATISSGFGLSRRSSFEAEFRRCRLQRKLGHFNEAVDGLERLQNFGDDLNPDGEAQIVGQIAWTRLQQGFFKESYEVLELWTRTPSNMRGSISSKTKVFLELVMEFSRVNCHGDPRKSVEVARAVFDKELRHVNVKDYNYALVCGFTCKSLVFDTYVI